jgi:hypothetical protein
VPKLPEVELPADLSEAETVGLLFDEVDGLNFLRDFGRVEETFADPALADEPKHREVVLRYLEDPSLSPGVLRPLAERDPQQATQVFRRLLLRPRFSWESRRVGAPPASQGRLLRAPGAAERDARE